MIVMITRARAESGIVPIGAVGGRGGGRGGSRQHVHIFIYIERESARVREKFQQIDGRIRSYWQYIYGGIRSYHVNLNLICFYLYLLSIG